MRELFYRSSAIPDITTCTIRTNELKPGVNNLYEQFFIASILLRFPVHSVHLVHYNNMSRSQIIPTSPSPTPNRHKRAVASKPRYRSCVRYDQLMVCQNVNAKKKTETPK